MGGTSGETTDIGAIVRRARRVAGLTQKELGLRCGGYSPSTISRIESGRQPLRDVFMLRRVARALSIPLQQLGLTDEPSEPPRHAHDGPNGASAVRPGPRVGSNPMREGGGDLVRRRDVLAGLAAVGSSLSWTGGSAAPDPDPADLLVSRMQDHLFRAPRMAPAAPDVVGRTVATVWSDFQAARYRPLASRLPRLLGVAEATASAADDAAPAAYVLLAQAYTVGAEVLLKLGELGLGWTTADRAVLAARQSGSVLAQGQATRIACMVHRKAEHHDKAIALAVEAADALDAHRASTSPEHLAVYGLLLSTAGYTAAQTGDRELSGELLDAAEVAARGHVERHGGHYTKFGPAHVAVYRVSASWALGDAGTAVSHARTINPGELSTERRARYLVDVARAYKHWGKPVECMQTLLSAERVAPEEVRVRPLVRSIARHLLSLPSTVGLACVRDFAARVGAA